MAQQQQEEWVTFDEEEEAVSLSDFPALADEAEDKGSKASSSDAVEEDFEFRISAGGGLLSSAAETDMCAADEVFFQGQILPLRPSVSSDGGLLGTGSRCASRSDSMERYSSAISSLGFASSRSSSSGSGSGSGCHSSSNGHSSASCEPPRLSASNNFYAHPSPRPQVLIVRKSNAGRKSVSSSTPGWGIFRLGVVKTPEIELHDLRSRRSSGGVGGGGGMNHPKKSINGKGEQGIRKVSVDEATVKGEDKVEKKASWFMGRGLGCKCSPDSVGVVSSKVVITSKKREEGEGLKGGESMWRSRICEWLEDLSVISKGAAARS